MTKEEKIKKAAQALEEQIRELIKYDNFSFLDIEARLEEAVKKIAIILK